MTSLYSRPLNQSKVQIWTLTALSDGSGRGQVSVLPVHVVGAAAGIVAQPDTEVLHLQRRLLVDLNREQQVVRRRVRGRKEETSRLRRRHSPGHSRRSLQRPSSSSSAGKQSTRSETWPRCGSGQRSSSGTEGGQGSWWRAADAQ